MSLLPGYCSYDGCESPREGRTEYCSSHNKGLRDLQRDLSRPVKPVKSLRRVPVQKISAKQMDITVRLNEVYEMMDAAEREFTGGDLRCHAYPHLNDDQFDVTIDHSHTISRARCKQLGKPELIYDPENIEHLSRKAHEEWDNYEPAFIKHANFQKRMDYIKQHDSHDYERRMAIWAKYNQPKETV